MVAKKAVYKGYKRPIFDPEAPTQTPIGWTYTLWNLQIRVTDEKLAKYVPLNRR